MANPIGIFSRTFARPNLDAVLDAIAAHGLTLVHFNFSSAGLPSLPGAITEELCGAVRHAFETRRFLMTSVSATFNAIHPDLRRRELDLQRACRIIQSCPRIGTSLVSLCTGSRDPDDMWKRHPANELPDAWADLLATLDRLLPVAEASGVTLGIEPERGNVISSAVRARRLLDEVRSPRLRIVIDGANLFDSPPPAAMRATLQEAFDLLGPEIVLAHAKDIADPVRASQAAGRGLLDWSSYLSLLRQSGYRGPVILHGLPESEVSASISFLREILHALS